MDRCMTNMCMSFLNMEGLNSKIGFAKSNLYRLIKYIVIAQCEEAATRRSCCWEILNWCKLSVRCMQLCSCMLPVQWNVHGAGAVRAVGRPWCRCSSGRAWWPTRLQQSQSPRCSAGAGGIKLVLAPDVWYRRRTRVISPWAWLMILKEKFL